MLLKDFEGKLKKIYHWLRYPGDSLSQRVVHGGVWVFGIRIVSRGFSLIRTIVLARLLAPNDFGLFGIAMLTLSGLERFSKTGFDQALVQKKEETETFLDTAWTVQVIRGFLLGGILVVGAPLVGLFFGEPRVILIVRVLGAAVALKSLRNIGVIYFRKDLEFHKQFVYEFSSAFADLMVALSLAFIFRSVWALIFGLLAKNITKFLISYYIHSYKPSLRFEWKKAQNLFSFGVWIFLSGLLGFLVTQGDDIFVGKFLSTSALGLYQLAYRISNLPPREITGTITRVIFPSYSKIQDSTEKMRELFFQVIKAVSSLVFPFSFAIFLLIPTFTNLILGEKWLKMVPAVQVLSFYGLSIALISTIGPLLWGTGKPEESFQMNLLRTVVLAITIYPLTKYFGIVGTSIATLLAVTSNFPIFLFKIRRKLNIGIKQIWSETYSLVISSLGMSLVISLIIVFHPVNSMSLLLLTIFAGFASYLFFNFLFWRYLKVGLFCVANEILKQVV